MAVPVVCYEILNEKIAPSPNPNARFAIINGVGQHKKMPFFGLLVQGIPRLKKVYAQDIQKVDAMGPGPLDVMAVSVDGEESAFIPDVDRIEGELLKYL